MIKADLRLGSYIGLKKNLYVYTCRLIRFKPEDRLRGLQPEDRLRGLQPEDRLRGLQPEDRLRGLQPEDVFKQFKPEDRLNGLDLKIIEDYLKTKKKNDSSFGK